MDSIPMDAAVWKGTDVHRENPTRSRRVDGFLLSIALLVTLSQAVQATTIPWGDPVLGHSWDQYWTASLDQNFDSLTLTVVRPPLSTFERPGFFGFSAESGWIAETLLTDSKEISATGPDTMSLQFWTHFNGEPTDYSAVNPLVVKFAFSNDGQLVDWQYWIYDGDTWFDPHDEPTFPAAVPDGGTTLLLLGIGTFGMVWLRKKLTRSA
jgi:hypothetical protein